MQFIFNPNRLRANELFSVNEYFHDRNTLEIMQSIITGGNKSARKNLGVFFSLQSFKVDLSQTKIKIPSYHHRLSHHENASFSKLEYHHPLH